MMRTYLGMDLGGTKLLIGEMDETGKILRSKRYKTGFESQQQAVMLLMQAIEDYRETVGFAGEPVAAGVGIVGVIDHANGIWVAMDHIRSNPLPLAQMLTDTLGIPAAIDNDVRCGTTAELLLGYGRETRNFIYMNIGTGIAAGFVTDGKIIRGQNNNSGEIGHTVVAADSGVQCVCGRVGCLEAIASGRGLAGRAAELALQSIPTELVLPDNGEFVNIAEVFRLADEGDALCARITSEAADALACGIMNLVRVTDPDTFILGGGIISDGWLLPKIKERLNRSTMRGVKNGVVISKFDPDFTGLIGAGAIAMVKAGALSAEL